MSQQETIFRGVIADDIWTGLVCKAAELRVIVTACSMLMVGMHVQPNTAGALVSSKQSLDQHEWALPINHAA